METKAKFPLQYKILIGAAGLVGGYLLVKKFQVELKAFIANRKKNTNSFLYYLLIVYI